MNKFFVTYEIVSPESAENGEACERGFMMPGDWRIKLEPHVYGEAASKVRNDCALDLRSAVGLVDAGCEDCGQWFTEIDSRFDYEAGNDELRSLHPPDNITSASYGRLKRLLKCHL